MKIAISLGGSLLTGEDEGISLSPEAYRKYAGVLKHLHGEGHEVMVVCGGGKHARYFIDVSKKLHASRDIQDNIGIKSTHINAYLLMAALGDAADTNRIFQRGSDTKYREPGKIWVGGGYKPKSSHDYRAVIQAKHMKADLIIKATDVDGVYDKNPQTHDNSKKYKSLSYNQLKKIIKDSTKQLPGEYGLFDMKGVRLAEKLGIPIVFIDGRDPWEIVKAVEGTHDGTTVHI